MLNFEDGTEKTPAQQAWDMFEKTGDISYYLAYKRMTVEKKNGRKT